MNKKRTPLLALAVLFAGSLSFYSCVPDEEYPLEPQIEFLDFVRYGNDSASFRITFTDGDGDIGLAEEDTVYPYHESGDYYFNCLMPYEYKNSSGNFVPFMILNPDTNAFNDTIASNDSIPLVFPYRIPLVLLNGQVKALNGEIHIKMYAPYKIHPAYRYQCYIYDRALNKSNVITSPEFN